MFVNCVNLGNKHMHFQFIACILLTPIMMKAKLTSKTLLVISVLVFSMLNAYAQDETSDQLVGTWTKSMNGSSAHFMISSDQTWEVEFTGDNKADVFGSYTIAGNQITFTDKGGNYSSGTSGVYEFQVDDTSLNFTIVDDPVSGRSMVVKGTWTRAGENDD